MTEGINLAEKQTTTKKKRDPFILLSGVIIFCMILASGSLFAFSIFLKTNLSNLLVQEDQQIKHLTTLTSEKTKILTIQERLSAIQRILTTRKEMSTNFEAVSLTIPEGVQISSITSTEKGLNIKLVSDSLASLNTFLEDRLPTILQDKSVKVKKIDISGFSFQRGISEYTTMVNFTFL